MRRIFERFMALGAQLLVAFSCCCLVAANVVWAAPSQLRATGAQVEQSSPAASTVVVQFSAQPEFTARLSKDRTRLTVDVANSEVLGVPATLTPDGGKVAGVMIQGFGGATPTTRVIVTFREPAEYSVVARASALRIRVGQPDGTTSSSVAPKPSDLVSAIAGALVERVDFDVKADAQHVSIALSGRAKFTKKAISPTVTQLLIEGALMPEELERTLDVGAFGGVVRAVSSYRQGADRVVVEAEHESTAQSHAQLENGKIVWQFFSGQVPSTLSGVGSDGKIARRTRAVAAEAPLLIEQEQDVAVQTSVADQAAAFTTAPILGQQRGRYSGRRIDLDFKDADVHNVLRLLADTGRVNIVAADNVSGAVTIRMRNVPWDQALDVVLQAKNLGMDRKGNIIRVAPQADLEKEREMAIARKRQELQLAPLETRLIPVSYATASDLQARARELLSGRGSISVDERTNVMIVRDVAGNLDQIEELTRSLDTQTPQVLIEARIVEATSRYLHEVGIQWGGDASFSAATGNPTGLAFPSSVGLAGGASDSQTPTAGLSPFSSSVENPNFAVNLPSSVGTGEGGALGLTLGSVDGNFNLSLRLSAAETNGMLRILSSPRVLTLDNSEARISQGTLIPFSQVSAQGVQTTFQEAKLQLLVRPHVTADGSVSMHVKINRDEPDFNQTSARGDPTILKREAETELLVMDGHTAVIGGIFTRNTGRNVNQVPFFGDIPLLGLLFQHRSSSDTRGELVIFLTPRIVNRAQALGR
jgi:type IV pilus assembly protein PilQ